MFPIPPSGSEARERMIAEHRACINDMKGVAGCSILRTERPGSAIEPHGGIHEHTDLAKVLVRMRAMQPGSYGGKYVVVCTEVDRHEIQHDIFLLRLDQYPETDGMPKDFHEGWKRHDDHWAVS